MKFKSQKEIYQALIDGEVLVDSHGYTVGLDGEGNQIVFTSGGVLCTKILRFDEPKEWTIKKEFLNVSLTRFEEIFKDLFRDNYTNVNPLFNSLKTRLIAEKVIK